MCVRRAASPLTGVERVLKSGAGCELMLAGELLASDALVFCDGFIRVVAGRKEHQGGDAADEHCGDNESEVNQDGQGRGQLTCGGRGRNGGGEGSAARR